MTWSRGAFILVALSLLEGLVRYRRWGLLPPAPAEALRGVVVDAPPDCPTLVVLGDSIPWGYGLPDPRMAWPVRLGLRLQETPRPWRVVDVSLPGETSLQSWARWHRDVVPWRPQRVLIALGTNDCYLRYTSTDAWRWAHVPRGVGRWIRLWHLWRVLWRSQPVDAPPQWAPRLTPAQSALIFRYLLQAAYRIGAEPWVITPPPPGPQAHAEWPHAFRVYQRDVCARTRVAILGVAAEFGAGTVDLWAVLSPPDPAWYQEDGIHLSPAGHARVAEEVLATLHGP